LNRGDTAKAMIAALHLRLPALSPDQALKITQVNDDLSKYNADQPRDWHGRWTDEDGAGPDPLAPSAAHDFQSEGGEDDGEGEPPPMGGNLPPGGPRTGLPEDPVFPAEKVPAGWDKPGYWDNGQYHQPIRLPTLQNGTPWPQPTIHLIKTIMASQPGKNAVLPLFVPHDGIGPTLLGADTTKDYPKPAGYDVVMLYGTPQQTFSRDSETAHARDCVNVALRAAATNRYSAIYFNRAISTVTGGAQAVALRPDVVAVVRPELVDEPTYEAFEIYSPGQDPKTRATQLKGIKGLISLDGETLKIFIENGKLIMKYIRRVLG
jgi:hypothetical protein